MILRDSKRTAATGTGPQPSLHQHALANTVGPRTNRVLLVSLLFTLLVAGRIFGQGTQPPTTRSTDQPNLVIIFIDDLGYADITPFGCDKYPTPQLQRMADEGMRFTNFVASTAVCSASRASLLTGCYPPRVGIRGALNPNSKIGISNQELTLAELCQQQGYATGCFGKWHLGVHREFLPLQHGFDQFFGIPYSNDMWPLHPDYVDLPPDASGRKRGFPDLPMFEGNQVVVPAVTGEHQEQFTSQFTQRSVEFIQQNADRPFFLYVPHPMAHVPLFVSEKFQGKSGAGLYGDVVMEIDWSLGQIMNTLRELKLEEKTLVIFTSDNGPWLSYGGHGGSASPLREGKGTMWEGGYRVPTLMWWPGTIPANSSCEELASTIDILPTVAELIGGQLPTHPIDGKNIFPLMQGNPAAVSPHQTFACYYDDALIAVRDNRFKLVFPHRYRSLNGRTGRNDGTPIPYQQLETGVALYDLTADISETTNVAAQYPDVVARLEQEGDRFRDQLGDALQNKKGSAVRQPGRIE